MNGFTHRNNESNITHALSVFVYGTLKPECCNFEHLCNGRVNATIPALTKGKLYQIPFYTEKYTRGYPAMTLETGWVEGYLFEFKDAEILVELDQLEGYQEGRSPQENEYQRLLLPIFTVQKEPLMEAWVYVMTPENIAECGGFALNRNSW